MKAKKEAHASTDVDKKSYYLTCPVGLLLIVQNISPVESILESFKKRQLSLGSRKLPEHAHLLYPRYDGIDHNMVSNQDKQTRCASCHKKCNFLCQKM
nr:unnamed protein product [Callosobruchus chinensis]